MTQEEIQNLKAKLGLNYADENLSGAGIKLKRVFELLEQAQEELTRLKNAGMALDKDRGRILEENERYRQTLEDIRDNWDCDSDAHKYGTSCRCCIARKALEGSE